MTNQEQIVECEKKLLEAFKNNDVEKLDNGLNSAWKLLYIYSI